MNKEAIKAATRQWAKDNGDTIDTACNQLALFLSSGITSAMPFNYFALLVSCVLGEDNKDAAARLVMQTLEETAAARELIERAWNTNGNEAGLLFDAAARIDPTIDTAALKKLHAEKRTAATHQERQRRGLI